MSKRNLPRIDYQILHSSGRKIYSADQLLSELSNLSLEEAAMTTNEDAVKNLTVLIASVNDAIEETPIRGLTSTTRTDSTISEMKSFREKLRTLKIDTKLNGDHHLIQSADQAISAIRSYILSAQDHVQKLELAHNKEATQEAARKERSMVFIIEDIQQQLTEIETTMTQNLQEAEEKELIKLKDESTIMTDRIEKISVKYEKLLQSRITDGDALHAIRNIGDRYMKVNSHKSNFSAAVNQEYSERELDKDYSMTNIKIKIDRFCGYESSIDFYTFKSNFDKLYLKSTPTSYLPCLIDFHASNFSL